MNDREQILSQLLELLRDTERRVKVATPDRRGHLVGVVEGLTSAIRVVETLERR